MISRYGVGVDMIDLVAAREHGIRVANVRDFCIEEVSSHTLCFVLALGRKIVFQDRLIRKGLWQMGEALSPMERFSSQTLGLIGLGRIGMRVAKLATALGFRILGYDVQAPRDPGPVHCTDLETVLRESDFVSLHCPLTEGTRHMINAEALSKMKPSAFLINVARGSVVDTAALVEALSSEQIAGAALDVFEEEPLPAAHALRKLENVILTPHSASASSAAVKQLREQTARNVLEFFQNEHKQ
jgi:D-3-phosphoglycerate dehydrogenase